MNLLIPELATEYETIEGLGLLEEFISPEEERKLLETIDQQPWMNDLKRRVQHYGYRYEYKNAQSAQPQILGPIPQWLECWCSKLVQVGIFQTKPNQVIINEYLAGQGIAAHIDSVANFGSIVCSLSLGADIIMTLTKDRSIDVLLKRCSLLVLSGSARYQWQHGIAPRKTDRFFGETLVRQRRVSVTFRSVKSS